MSMKLSEEHSLLNALTATLQGKVPQAILTSQSLPLVPEIELMLIDDGYPQSELTADQVSFLMDQPPYWAFCWASGQVMARYLFDNAELVRGRSVIDFGCGSGVVAIAAKMAGAARVFAVDSDPAALLATKLNAGINGQTVEPVCSLDDSALNDKTLDENAKDDKKRTQKKTNTSKATKHDSLLLIADVFYDSENFPMLSRFIDDYDDVIVADSRVKFSNAHGLMEVERYSSHTLPDLDESASFNSVGIYRVAESE